jgi:hypothetical protein
MGSRETIFGTSFENKRALRFFEVGRGLEKTKMDNARYIVAGAIGLRAVGGTALLFGGSRSPHS